MHKAFMIGEVVVVVIDEIGEVTFTKDPMFPDSVEISKKETVARAMAAIGAMIDVIYNVLPTSDCHFRFGQASELFFKHFDHFVDRVTEQVEFEDAARKR